MPLCALPRRMCENRRPQLRQEGHTIFCLPPGKRVRIEFFLKFFKPIISLPSQWFPAPCATAGRIRIYPGRRSCTKRCFFRQFQQRQSLRRRYRRRLNRAEQGGQDVQRHHALVSTDGNLSAVAAVTAVVGLEEFVFRK